MCDPVSITLGVTAAALSAGSVAAQISAQNKAAKRSAQSAKEALAADVQQSQIQAEQIQAQTTQETLALKREALQRRGALLAAQSSTGFFGNSPLREELNLRLKESEALGTIEENQATRAWQNTGYGERPSERGSVPHDQSLCSCAADRGQWSRRVCFWSSARSIPQSPKEGGVRHG
jgi:hypothetical protein